MPAALTYPGVYVEELPSGVRTITGVATSITAFLGRARWGSVNQPVRIQSFADFERQFGGLWIESTMSYAVQQFFLNGGADALIVRLVHIESGETPAPEEGEEAPTPAGSGETPTPEEGGETPTPTDSGGTPAPAAGGGTPAPSASTTTTGKATITLPGTPNPLVLEAANEGTWGNRLQAFVDYDTADSSNTALFNLTVEWTNEKSEVIASETFRNLEVNPNGRRFVTEILSLESALVRVLALPTARPTASTVGTDGKVQAVKAAQTGSDGIALLESHYTGSEANKEGIFALESADLFNLLCLPPITRDQDISVPIWTAALAYCEKRRALLIVDAPQAWKTHRDVANSTGLAAFVQGMSPRQNAAMFFPRVKMADPLKENRLVDFAPCGAIAGIMARTDVARGVWKAPAGTEATITGARQLTVKLTDGENGVLNPLGVNCLRSFPVYGNVVWGARTLAGDDRLGSEWKYVPVRRLALFLEESLYRGTQWVVFEPNDEPLWAQIRLNVGAFMQNLFRQGAFQGSTPKEAYFVKCDRETTTQNDINLGIVNIVVGYAPLKPAEFVVLKFQQIAGQIDT
ncbi:MAG: phage tail sheath subtilisin-like domain-containing protein [Cyanobacteria bacterium J06621_3]